MLKCHRKSFLIQRLQLQIRIILLLQMMRTLSFLLVILEIILILLNHQIFLFILMIKPVLLIKEVTKYYQDLIQEYLVNPLWTVYFHQREFLPLLLLLQFLICLRMMNKNFF
ncbi:hypothetical protein C1646_693142 [Rhizophagus diaphanus]|nr:hypothetical protein C1646_693142 [Rhizophagus diaphanus] [Rhizophagus sp. MUCL 43196]